MITRVTLVTLLALLTAAPAQSQERFSFFQASTPESVERMLRLADLKDDDVVIDLGSGNGLIPLTAARMNRRLQGRGVDINPMLVEESNQQARSEGFGDRVRFEHRNAFDVDLREATVVTMWLFPELMRLLRPVILERARPGRAVLTSTWDLGSWKPDKVDMDGAPIYLSDRPGADRRRVAVGSGGQRPPGSLRLICRSAVPGRRRRGACGRPPRGARGIDRARAKRDVYAGDHARRSGPDSARIQRQGRRRRDHRHREGNAEGSAVRDAGVACARVASNGSDYFAPTGTAMFEQPAVRSDRL